MHICFVGDRYSYHVMRWVTYFSQFYKVSLVEYNPISDYQVDFYDSIYESCGVNIYKIYCKWCRYEFLNDVIRWVFYLYGAILLRIINPDIVHALRVTENSPIVAMSGLPSIVTVFGSDVFILMRQFLSHRISGIIGLKYSDVITCDGVNMIEYLSTHYNIMGAKYICHGVDNHTYNISRRKLHDKFTILYSRGWVDVYSPTTVIRSFEEIHTKFPEIRLIMCGRGSNEYMKLCASEFPHVNYIEYMGLLMIPDLIDLLSITDIYISHSLSDSGISSGVIESMMFGIPVISTPSGDHGNFIKHGYNGFLVDYGDSYGISKLCIDLYSDADLRERIGKCAYEDVQLFSVDRCLGREMNDVYIQLYKKYYE